MLSVQQPVDTVDSKTLRVLEKGDAIRDSNASLCRRFVSALFGDFENPTVSTLNVAFAEIEAELPAYGLKVFTNSTADNNVETLPVITSTLSANEQQSLLDDLFVALCSRKLGYVLMSEFLARIWQSSQMIPSQLRLGGVVDVTMRPFAATMSSNVNEGVMANDTPIALKTFRHTKTKPPTEEHIQRFFFEALVTATTQHRNIMPLLGIHVGTSGEIYLVSKLKKYGILPHYLLAHPAADKLLMLEKLADALVHLHNLSIPVLHGDIRGMNVLVDDDGEPLLIDFGLSLVYDSVTDTFLPLCHRFEGNPRWTPHEKMPSTEGDETFPLTLKADSFSFASLIFEVLSSDVPYSYLKSNSAVILEVIVRNKTPKRPNAGVITDALWDFMNKCWSRNPDDRPSMEGIRCFLAAMRLQH